MILEQIVEENKDFLRVDGGIVNRNDLLYHQALQRRKDKTKIDLLEERVSNLEHKLNKILTMIEDK